MLSDKSLKSITEYVNPLVSDMGLEPVEIQFIRESHGWVLRIFIDSIKGITVDNCANVSREVSAFLDVEDIIEVPYTLEVSSPGLDRPLKQIQDFIRYTGRKVKIILKEPVNSTTKFCGIIEQIDGDHIVLKAETGKVNLSIEKIVKGQLVF